MVEERKERKGKEKDSGEHVDVAVSVQIDSSLFFQLVYSFIDV